MGDILNLEHERVRREMDAFMELVHNARGDVPELDVSQHTRLAFRTILSSRGMVMPDESPAKPEEYELALVAFDISGEHPRPVGILRVTEQQWTLLMRAGNDMLEAGDEIADAQGETF